MIKAEWTNKDSLDLQPTCNQLATTDGDLISRRDVLNTIIVADECEPDLGYTHLHKVVENIPSADAVEVIRCKDCLMTKERDEYTGKVWCCRHREYMDDMYYCADGLCREDGEEE